MATRLVLTPYAAEFPATNFPQLTVVNTRPVGEVMGALRPRR
jgi:hypothetical protein